jgi:hypothetical protein
MRILPFALAVGVILAINASPTLARDWGHGSYWDHDQHVRPGTYHKPTPGHPMLYKPVPGHPWMTRPFAGHPWVPALGGAHHYRPHHWNSCRPYGHHYRHPGRYHGGGGFSLQGPRGGFSIRW